VPTREGRAKTGWLILFTGEETRRMAESAEQAAAPLAAAMALVPDPGISKVVAAGSAAVVAAAKIAVRREKALGIYVNGALWYYNRNFRRLRLKDLPRYLYAKFTMLCVPFFYDARDPESLASWRRAVGM
jgi:hypothetical protein